MMDAGGRLSSPAQCRGPAMGFAPWDRPWALRRGIGREQLRAPSRGAKPSALGEADGPQPWGPVTEDLEPALKADGLRLSPRPSARPHGWGRAVAHGCPPRRKAHGRGDQPTCRSPIAANASGPVIQPVRPLTRI